MGKTPQKPVQNGFSLVEMVVYLTILSVMLVVLTEVFVSTLNTRAESETASAIDEDGRFLMSRVSYDVGRSQAVAVPAPNTLQLTIDGLTNTYGLSGSNLVLTNAAGTARLNGFGTSVSSVSFERIGNAGGKQTVRTSFRLTSVGQRSSGTENKDFAITVGQR